MNIVHVNVPHSRPVSSLVHREVADMLAVVSTSVQHGQQLTCSNLNGALPCFGGFDVCTYN